VGDVSVRFLLGGESRIRQLASLQEPGGVINVNFVDLKPNVALSASREIMIPSVASIDVAGTMQAGRFLYSLLAVILFIGSNHRAEGAVLLQSEEVTISGEPSLKSETVFLHSIFPEIMKDLRNALPWELRARPRITLTSDPRLFEQITGSRFITAFALPSQQLVAMLIQAGKTTRPALRGTLTHELCHLILHENIERSLLPKWLDEGVCQWVSGSLGEILSGDSVNRNDVEIGRRAIPLRELSDQFPREGEALLLAYAGSRSFVEYLAHRWGVEGLHGILRRLQEGHAVATAVDISLGLTLEDLEGEWLETLRGGRAWLSWLGRHFYDLLFFATALLTVLAAVRLVLRRRTRLAEMEDE
jgi:hypothetical protein